MKRPISLSQIINSWAIAVGVLSVTDAVVSLDGFYNKDWSLSTAIFLALGAILVFSGSLLAVDAIRRLLGVGLVRLQLGCVDVATAVTVDVAVVIAGRSHAHLREAWEADLFGDPDSGQLPSAGHRVRLSAGFVAAAVRCRADDVAAVGWRRVDEVLGSWHGSRVALVLPTVVAAVAIVAAGGLYGLVVNAENLGVIGAASYAAVRGLRRYRDVSAPQRPRPSAADSQARADERANDNFSG